VKRSPPIVPLNALCYNRRIRTIPLTCTSVTNIGIPAEGTCPRPARFEGGSHGRLVGLCAWVLVVSLVVGAHLGHFRQAYTEMAGMMAGMTMVMLNGFLQGTQPEQPPTACPGAI
jgi:hypothetical protein